MTSSLTLKEKLSSEKIIKKAKAFVATHGVAKLVAAFERGDSQSPDSWNAMDIAVMALLVGLVPGGTLAAIYYRTLRFNGLSSDTVGQWQVCGAPTLQVGSDAAHGSIDDQPILLIKPPESRGRDQKTIEDLEGWVEKTQQFLVHDNMLEESLGKVCPELATPVAKSTYDAFREIPEMDIHKAALAEPLNSITKMPTEKVFTAKYTGDFTAAPTNARGNFKKLASVSRLGTSNGLHYHADDKTQVLQTAATRYAVQQKAFVIDEEARRLARDIANNMFDQIIDTDKLAQSWNDVSSSDTYLGWLKKSRSAGYSNSHSLSAEEDDRILRFQGKGNFKAKEDPVTFDGSFKAPQGILAWSKGANSFFGYSCRMISNVIKDSLKEEVVWNNGMSVEEAATRFTKASMNVPTPQNVRLDAVEMDSKQNEFTHLINRLFLERLFVSCEFLDLYFSLYAEYTVIHPEIKMHLRWVKPSGAPWTLMGNSFLMLSLCLWLIQGDGPMALFTQGDDVDRNQANMRINSERMAQLSLYCGFEMSMEWGDFAAFCGYVLQNGQLVPNIRRKLVKLSGCNFKSQKHFEEVQIGMRGYCDSLKNHLGFSDIIQVNAETYKVPYEVAEAWFECIDSLSHISAEQFSEASTRVQLNTNFMAEGKRGRFDSLEQVY